LSATRAGRRSRRGRSLAVAVAFFVCTAPALAQGPCDSPAVKTYISDFGGTRTPPPPAWQKCVDSLGPDPYGLHKGAVLQAFAVVRARKGQAGEPTEGEKRLFQGGGRAMILRDMLEGWRANLGVHQAEQRFDNVFYQAFLGALSWSVLDRSSRLETACVAPVERLRSAVAQGPDWRAVESALRSFGDVPLWKDSARDEPSLTRLRDQIAGLTPSDLGRACPRVRALPAGPAYWSGLSKELGQITPALVVDVPRGCGLPACQAARSWQASATRETWSRVVQKYEDDLAGLEHRFATARSALPAGTAWKTAEDSLNGLREQSGRFRQAREPNGADAAQEIVRGLRRLDDMTRLAGELEEVALSGRALGSLAAGDVREAKQILGTRRSWKGAAAPLVAAYVTTCYWEKGRQGRQDACRETGMECSRDSVVRELVKVARILRIPEQDLKP